MVFRKTIRHKSIHAPPFNKFAFHAKQRFHSLTYPFYQANWVHQRHVHSARVFREDVDIPDLFVNNISLFCVVIVVVANLHPCH